jgi:hypothetical protein
VPDQLAVVGAHLVAAGGLAAVDAAAISHR